MLQLLVLRMKSVLIYDLMLLPALSLLACFIPAKLLDLSAKKYVPLPGPRQFRRPKRQTDSFLKVFAKHIPRGGKIAINS